MNSCPVLPATTSNPLPDTAPQVRLTAGAGTAGQKTWNLQRPATLIGSRRPAHIVLHDPATCDAHCVILNTGDRILLMDLFTPHGTLHNGNASLGATTLADGDSITVGETVLRIGIDVPEVSTDERGAARGTFSAASAQPISVCTDDGETAWRVEETITLVGRHPDAAVCLDHPNVSTRHAVLFPFLDGWGVFDTGSETGVWVDGVRCTFARLDATKRMLIGPYSLTVVGADALAAAKSQGTRAAGGIRASGGVIGESGNSPFHAQTPLNSPFSVWKRAVQKDSGNAAEHSAPNEQGTSAPASMEAGNPDWDSLNTLPSDGAGSGDLHRRENALLRREAEFQRRERLLVRRWTQLLSAKCSKCGRPIATPDTPPAG